MRLTGRKRNYWLSQTNHGDSRIKNQARSKQTVVTTASANGRDAGKHNPLTQAIFTTGLILNTRNEVGTPHIKA